VDEKGWLWQFYRWGIVAVAEAGPLSISIVIPALNERECIGPLLREIAESTANLPITEIIVVDDGSDDGMGDVIRDLKSKLDKIRLVRHAQRRGQSTATYTGISAARGDLIVTLDADGQNDPAGIELLYTAYVREADRGRIMVAGQRRKRQDNLVRRFSSRVANTVRRWILDDGVRDTGCSLKLFRRSDFMALPFFDHIHRFIPALMKASGVRIVIVEVAHRPRERGISKYGLWDRLWVGIHDLVGVRWLIARMRKDVGIEEV
jgi:dolichol-phosphate mannosyltransferase